MLPMRFAKQAHVNLPVDFVADQFFVLPLGDSFWFPHSEWEPGIGDRSRLLQITPTVVA